MTATDDPFMTASNAPAIKFETPGDVHAITVRRVEQKIDTDLDGEVKTWPNGDPMHVFVFNGEDVDGDPAALWVRGNMVKAIREATAAAGLPSVINTKVTVKFTGHGEPKKGKSPAKLFAAKVEAVAPAPAAGGFGDEEPF